MEDFYFISVAARMLGMHPQTLRKYERLGLVQPGRPVGSMRVYTADELARLKVIKRLVDDERLAKPKRPRQEVDLAKTQTRLWDDLAHSPDSEAERG